MSKFVKFFNLGGGRGLRYIRRRLGGFVPGRITEDAMSILDKPEEAVMAVLAALFVVLTYAAASCFGARRETALLVAALTLIVLLPAFLLWQRNRAARLWPCLLSALAACWWPFLDGVAGPEDLPADALPWYATWTFKLVFALLPAAAGYGWMLYRRRSGRKKPPQ